MMAEKKKEKNKEKQQGSTRYDVTNAYGKDASGMEFPLYYGIDKRNTNKSGPFSSSPMNIRFSRQEEAQDYADELQRETRGMKKGGAVKSASKRADGCAQRGKTRGKMV